MRQLFAGYFPDQISLREGLNVFNGINGPRLIFWPVYGQRLISLRYG